MRPQLILIILLLSTTACRRTYTHICSTPNIILQQNGYDATEWDTIITRVINVEFQEIEAVDTFIATDVTNELLITPDFERKLAFEVSLPSVNKTHYIHGIEIIPKTEEVKKGLELECYHDIYFEIDNQPISGLSTANGRVYAQLEK